MNEHHDGRAVTSSENASEQAFVPPQGWTRSPNVSRSRFAREVSNTTTWYVNDGQGNGYFAPGWDNERLARRAGVLRWIALALATVILGVGIAHFAQQYGEQSDYDQVKAVGVETSGVVGPVTVEHSTRVSRQSGRKYITRTTATVEYVVHDRVMHGEISASSSASSSFESTGQYPEPAWAPGQVLTVYADPARPERFVLFHEYKEADAEGMPRGAVLVLIFTAAFLVLPVALFMVGVRNVREARKL